MTVPHRTSFFRFILHNKVNFFLASVSCHLLKKAYCRRRAGTSRQTTEELTSSLPIKYLTTWPLYSARFFFSTDILIKPPSKSPLSGKVLREQQHFRSRPCPRHQIKKQVYFSSNESVQTHWSMYTISFLFSWQRGVKLMIPNKTNHFSFHSANNNQKTVGKLETEREKNQKDLFWNFKGI